MAKFKLTVVELAENPDYGEQLKKYQEDSRYGRSIMDGYPASYIERRTLEIVLDDAEYQAVRKAVLGTFGAVSN